MYPREVVNTYTIDAHAEHSPARLRVRKPGRVFQVEYVDYSCRLINPRYRGPEPQRVTLRESDELPTPTQIISSVSGTFAGQSLIIIAVGSFDTSPWSVCCRAVPPPIFRHVSEVLVALARDEHIPTREVIPQVASLMLQRWADMTLFCTIKTSIGDHLLILKRSRNFRRSHVS